MKTNAGYKKKKKSFFSFLSRQKTLRIRLFLDSIIYLWSLMGAAVAGQVQGREAGQRQFYMLGTSEAKILHS